MEENEFLALTLGTVVSGKFDRNKYYVIDDTDQWGTSYKGKKYSVYGATQIEAPHDQIRIDLSNYHYWRIEGRMIDEKK